MDRTIPFLNMEIQDSYYFWFSFSYHPGPLAPITTWPLNLKLFSCRVLSRGWICRSLILTFLYPAERGVQREPVEVDLPAVPRLQRDGRRRPRQRGLANLHLQEKVRKVAPVRNNLPGPRSYLNLGREDPELETLTLITVHHQATPKLSVALSGM